MKKLNNLKVTLLAISFGVWVTTSLINPIISLFVEPTMYEYIIGFNSFIVVGFMITSIIPKTLKNKNLSDLNFKTGSTKEKKEGCKSCKRKKRF